MRGAAKYRLLVALVAALAIAFGLTGCSSSGGNSHATTSSTLASRTSAPPSTSGTPATTVRPSGPAADVSHELTGGKGVYLATATRSTWPIAGYVQHEYVAAGTATSYRFAHAPSRDGRWSFAAADSAPYRTRIVVRRPAGAAHFSGTVVVEWLNVSGGVDSGADWDTLHEEIVRAGDAWVGVSAQLIGVMGGPVLVHVPTNGPNLAGKGLRGIDPARYRSLQHPGDGYSYDIFTQVARAVRAGGALRGLRPERLIAAGESQSAIALVTYIDGVAPLSHAFDGYFVHSRGASGLPLAAPGKAAGIADSLGGEAVIFRTDQDAPILDVQTESDTGLLHSLAARQPDSAAFRLWEVAGTAHADAHLLGTEAALLHCGLPVNGGPMHLVAMAALHALDQWLRTGTAPPSAPRFQTAGGTKPAITRDADGIVHGGIRTPPVDVPVDVLSGVVAPDASTICVLSGSTKPLPPARIAQLYPSRSVYLERYATDADRTIAAGYVLGADRAALRAYAQPQRIAR